MNYLIDTNVISELVQPKPSIKVFEWFESVPSEALYISVLTFGEIRKGIQKLHDSKRKKKLRIWLEHELTEWFEDRILVIDRAVVDKWEYLQYEMKRPLPAIDSLLAATALHYDLSLVTRNVKDFLYPSLEVINPWQD